MMVITFFIGCFFFYFSKGDPINLKIKILFIGYLPFIIFLTIFLRVYFKGNFKLSKIILIIVKVILVFLLVEYYIAAIFICALEESMVPITDIKYYKDKVNDNLLKVFPKEIPSNVYDVKFSYLPGVLQGKTRVMLYYIDKDMTILNFDKMYKDKAVWIGHIKEYDDENGVLSGALSDEILENEDKDDYIIYLVNNNCDKSGYCNHGNVLLVAFNEDTKAILFKAEVW